MIRRWCFRARWWRDFFERREESGGLQWRRASWVLSGMAEPSSFVRQQCCSCDQPVTKGRPVGRRHLLPGGIVAVLASRMLTQRVRPKRMAANDLWAPCSFGCDRRALTRHTRRRKCAIPSLTESGPRC